MRRFISRQAVPRLTIRILAIVAVVGVLILLTWMLLQPTEVSHPTQADETSGPVAFSFTGAGSCSSSNCHGGVSPQPNQRIKQNEYSVWVVKDKHAKAYDVLFNDTSRRIARNLKLDNPEKSDKCLDCHALNVNMQLRSRSFDISDGVSCESCHGPAEKWLGPHTTKGWTHEKSVKLGMYDTKDVVKRAEKCLSCHLGTETKWVDHRMIAAGHPDLIFEFETYTAVMPPHWQETDDKGEWFGPRAWAVGQAVALREAMKQLARRAGSKAWSQAWPELAEFNCYACHHSLRQPSWRQERGYTSRPGAPTWNASRYMVFRHVVAQTSPDTRQALDEKIDRLRERFDQAQRRRQEIASVAADIASVADRFVQQLARQPFDQRLTRALLSSISGDGQAISLAGIRSAEQAAMALESLYASYSQVVTVPNHSAIKAAISRLFDDLENPARFNPRQFAVHMQAVHQFFN